MNREEINRRLDILTRIRIYLISKYNPIVEISLWASRKIVNDDDLIAATDGLSVYFGNGFFEEGKYTLKEQAFIYMHELMHVAFQHCHRKKRVCFTPMDLDIYNFAGDCFINHILGVNAISWLSMPSEAVQYSNLPKPVQDALPDHPETLTLEELYALMKEHWPKCQKPGSGGSGESGESQKGSSTVNNPMRDISYNDQELSLIRGKVVASDGVEPDELTQEAIEHQLRTMLGNMLKGDEAIGLLTKLNGLIPRTRTPWRRYLRNLVKSAIGTTRVTHWARPSSVSLAGIVSAYMPSVRKTPEFPQIYIAFDCSGSCWSEDIRREFASNVVGVAEQCGANIILALFDVRVQKVMQFQDTRKFLKEFLSLEYAGGWGTDFSYLFQPYIKDGKEEYSLKNVKVAIVLTDLYGDFPDKAPKYPVIWAGQKGILDAADKLAVPFGKIIEMAD
jgi:predicted metal-dependent peptidase